MIEEKQRGMLLIMLQLNVSIRDYLLSHWIIFMVMAFISTALATIPKILIKTEIFSLDNTPIMNFALILFSAQLLAATFAICLLSFVRRPVIINTLMGMIGIIFILTVVILGVRSGEFLWSMVSSESSVAGFYFMTLFIPITAISRMFEIPVSISLARENNSTIYVTDLFFISIVPFIGIFLLFVISWYLYQVCGDKDSAARKPVFFFFSVAYWSGKQKTVTSLIEGDKFSINRYKSEKEQSIILYKLSKSYNKGTSAVKELSLTMGSGCHALLGPNGAGKVCLLLAYFQKFI